MADELKESRPHDQRVSSVECVRDDHKPLHGMNQPGRKLTHFLLSESKNKESAVCLGNSNDGSKNIILQSNNVTRASSSDASSSAVTVQSVSDDKGILDYRNSEDLYDGFDKFGLAAATSWCDYSDRRNDCVKQTAISGILTNDDRNIGNVNDSFQCEREPQSIFEDTALGPLDSRFESDGEWEMDKSALDDGSPMMVSDFGNRAFPLLDSKSIVEQKTATQYGTLPCLLIGQHDELGCSLAQDISQVVGEHQLVKCRLEEALSKMEERTFALIWLKLSNPSLQDGFSLLESLRASNGKNKESHIILVVSKHPNVDLHTKGADDVMVEPVAKETIKKICLKFAADMPPYVCHDNSRPNDVSIMELTSTPESNLSTSTKRTDLDLDSSSPSKSTGVSPPRWCRMEHATKEKQRRERIKDSCDQLRVLLPYVKGRKTDMASILEMTVDYLKIVSSALPEDFHSEIIEIMSTGGSPADGHISQNVSGTTMAVAKKGAKKGTVAAVRSNVESVAFGQGQGDVNVNKRMTTRALSRAAETSGSFDLTEVSPPVQSPTANNGIIKRGSEKNSTVITAKREYPGNAKPAAKRQHINPKTTHSDNLSPSIACVPVVNPDMDSKRESFFDDLTSNTSSYHGLQYPPSFTGTDISSNKRAYTTSQNVSLNDPFPYSTQMNQQTSRMNSIERTDLTPYGNLYLDSAYYHYPYSSLQDSSNGNYFLPPGTNEYVNPNTVLPVTTYTPRVAASGRKLDRMSSTAMSRLAIDNLDSYNNNTNSNTNTNSTFLNSTSL